MSREFTLTTEQQMLVEKNINQVKYVIYDHILVNETIFGLGFDDLYQEGCIWLCKAATLYDGVSAKFETYARTVVRNGLITYCKRMCNIQKRQSLLSNAPIDSEDEDSDTFVKGFAAGDEIGPLISNMDISQLLETTQRRYNGIARLGIEAIRLKTLGYTGADIAKLWGIEQNRLGACVSRAKSKLLKDETFIMGLNYVTKI